MTKNDFLFDHTGRKRKELETSDENVIFISKLRKRKEQNNRRSNRIRKSHKESDLELDKNGIFNSENEQISIDHSQASELSELSSLSDVTEADSEIHPTEEESDLPGTEAEFETSAEEKEVVVGGKSLRGTQYRIDRYLTNSDCTEFEFRRPTRQKERVNYSKQLMPPNFTQILDKEFGKDNDSSVKPNIKKKKGRLNESESDEEIIVPKGRICTLLSQKHQKNAPLPINIAEMMVAEEMRLLEMVDSETRSKFEQKRKILNSMPKHSIDFDSVAGLDERKIHLIQI
jgi:hypothetical protein